MFSKCLVSGVLQHLPRHTVKPLEVQKGPLTRKVTERCCRTSAALLVEPQENRFPNQSTY
jgi:hypothetical protein